MLNFLTSAFSALLISGIYASILILLAVILRQTVLKKAPRYILLLLWAVVLLKLMVPVTLPSPVSIYNNAPVLQNSVLQEPSMMAPGNAEPSNTIKADGGNLPARQSASEAPSALTAQRANFHPNSFQIASVIWACGAAGMLILVFAMTAATARRVKKKKPLQNDLLKAYLISVGRPNLRCFTLDNIPSPFVIGFFRQSLVIPEDLNTGSPELPYILYHELGHIRRRDNLWNLIALLTLSFYWFNPLIWIAYRLSSKDMEIACDENVLRRYGESHKADYAKVLLQLTTAQSHKWVSWKEGFVMGMGKPSIKERIKAIARYKKRNTIILVSGLVLVLIIAAVFGTGAVRRISSSSASSDTSGTQQLSDASGIPSGTAALETDASSSSAANSSDPSDQFKSILAKQTTDTVTFFQSFTTDKNQKAAFAVAGSDVWYVDASGAQKLGSDIGSWDNSPYDAPVMWTVGNTILFKDEEVNGGSGSLSHAWYVKDGKPVELTNTGMNLSYIGSGQFTTIGQAFDEFTSNGSEAGGHTYKLYYLYWTNDGLKEYGGLKITKQQLLKMKGAQEILNAITESGHTVDDIYYRADNIININYHSGNKQECNNGNVTLVYKNNTVTPQTVTTGQSSSTAEKLSKDNLSDFSYGGIYKAAYFPDIATYPDKFPLK